jgi:hypothetical protein
LSVPAAIAIGTQLHRRHKKGDLNLYEGMKDGAVVLGFVAAAISIAEAARKSQPPMIPAGSNVKDAQFTVTAPASQG